VDLKDISQIVRLKDHIPKDQLFLVEPYSQEFIMKLLAECKAYPELQISKLRLDNVGQIT